ncbi:MAG: hypothetical protein KDJ45_08885 [Hyphomicrobiaceae bacterium]|nr:hypothetical protein [Hyphomicrobiaceae bacterium]MCC0010799.1 hypothetical protein [Hyphomicrobiaceae bacterium]
MASIDWPKLNEIENDKLAAALRQAHNGVHWLARFANSYVETNGSGDPTQLVWNASDGVIQTKPFLDEYAVELRVGPLELQFREQGRPVPHAVNFEERTPAHIEAWALVELLHRGIDRERFSKMLPYQAADVMTGDHEEHEADAYKTELAAIEKCLRLGTEVLLQLRQRDEGSEAAGKPLTCWPQKFQIGYEMPLPPGSGAESLKVGISPGDAEHSQPYFFVSTPHQAQTASHGRESVLPLSEIAERGLDREAVVAELHQRVATLKSRLAG